MLALGYLVKRVGSALATLIVVTLVVFLSLQMIPGGYAAVVLGPRATDEAREQAEQQFGLDQPVVIQYLRWLGAVFQGDFGVSLVSRQPVLDELALRLPATLQIVALALVIAVTVGVSLGLIVSLSRRRFIRQSGRLLGSLSMSVPDFVVGSLLLFLATVGSWGMTNRGYVSFFVDPGGAFASALLPAITLSLGGLALIMRTLRDSVSTTLAEPFIDTAVARGDGRNAIIRRHVLRNSAAPTATVIALLVGMFLGGTVIVESLFSVPGVGLYFTNAVRSRDFAVVQAIVLLSATTFIVASMLADAVQALLDPRVAHGRRSS